MRVSVVPNVTPKLSFLAIDGQSFGAWKSVPSVVFVPPMASLGEMKTEMRSWLPEVPRGSAVNIIMWLMVVSGGVRQAAAKAPQ